MGDLPRPRIEPASPALAGGFFTTEATREAWETLFFFLASEYLIYAYMYIYQYLLNIPSEIMRPLIACLRNHLHFYCYLSTR